MCMHVYMEVCMYCMYRCIYLCIDTCMYVCMYVYMYVYMYRLCMDFERNVILVFVYTIVQYPYAPSHSQ